MVRNRIRSYYTPVSKCLNEVTNTIAPVVYGRYAQARAQRGRRAAAHDALPALAAGRAKLLRRAPLDGGVGRAPRAGAAGARTCLVSGCHKLGERCSWRKLANRAGDGSVKRTRVGSPVEKVLLVAAIDCDEVGVELVGRHMLLDEHKGHRQHLWAERSLKMCTRNRTQLGSLTAALPSLILSRARQVSW